MSLSRSKGAVHISIIEGSVSCPRIRNACGGFPRPNNPPATPSSSLNGRVEPVCPGIALEDEDLPIVIECDSKVPGVATQPCILEFFDLARVEKFKRRWARGERLQGSHELARRRYRKVFQ
jgi:hypothetical protein